MVRHVSEDVVIYVAEEVHLRLHPPVILHMFECRMFVEETAVPSTHLMVRSQASVLDVLFFEDLGGFLEELLVDPRRSLPVFVRYQL